MSNVRVQQHAATDVVRELQKALERENPLAVPRLKKIVVNAGIGRFANEPKKVEAVIDSITRITGQKPVVTKAKKSISNFKIRKGLGVGVMTTLRGRRMYDFLEKLVHVSLPRVRDFHGLPTTSFDRQGNYSIAFREHNVFPEIRSDEMEFIHGLQVTLCTTASNPHEAELLLRSLGLPLQELKVKGEELRMKKSKNNSSPLTLNP